MKLMLSMTGEAEQLPYLPEIAALGAGVELGSYGLVGIRSEEDWQARLRLHQAVRRQFSGEIAIHGPFLGMEFAHLDHLIRAAVERRMELTFGAAQRLRASRVVLHSGYSTEIRLFRLEEDWLKRNIDYWQREIRRWAAAGISIVIENDAEPAPDLLLRLVNAVDDAHLGLCLDIGHQHFLSALGAPEWVRRMAPRLQHLHLHDNDSTFDYHWPIGRGTIDFEAFFGALTEHAPQATLTLEVVDEMEVRMANLRMLAKRVV
jgi:sugar phosphate isomerase/epimerase